MRQKKSKHTASQKTARKSPLLFLLPLAGIALISIAMFLATRSQPSTRIAPKVIGAPALEADNNEIDLGDVRLGEWVQASFELTNVGDETLRFERPPYIEVIEGC